MKTDRRGGSGRVRGEDRPRCSVQLAVMAVLAAALSPFPPGTEAQTGIASSENANTINLHSDLLSIICNRTTGAMDVRWKEGHELRGINRIKISA